MKLRYLRITFSAGCGILCLLLVALWVRSYSAWDSFDGRLPFRHVFSLQSLVGRLTFHAGPLKEGETIEWGVLTVHGKDADEFRWVDRPGLLQTFYVFAEEGTLAAAIPHWFAALFLIFLAGVPWMPLRFSLRTMLVVVTVVAIGLGAIVLLR